MPTEYIRIAKPCKDCPLVFSCWNHLLLPLGIRNFTTHLLICSHSLERFYWNRFSFIGILILPSTIFHHLPPQKDEATMEQMATSRSLPSIHGHVNGENEWRKLRFRPMTFLGCPIRQTQLCEYARSSCQCHRDPLCIVYACTCTYHETLKRM